MVEKVELNEVAPDQLCDSAREKYVHESNNYFPLIARTAAQARRLAPEAYYEAASETPRRSDRRVRSTKQEGGFHISYTLGRKSKGLRPPRTLREQERGTEEGSFYEVNSLTSSNLPLRLSFHRLTLPSPVQPLQVSRYDANIHTEK